MSVLALRLAGPLQAWGASARFARRTTENTPTKSGVVGLLAAALGRPRTEDPSDLAGLRFGVRVDQPGVRVRDYQTARHLVTGESMPVSERFYVADAVFVVGMESDDADFLVELDRAVRSPHFLPYLGRRSCPPSRPIDLGIRPGGLDDVLRDLEVIPWQASEWYREEWKRRGTELPVFVETGESEQADELLRDLPESFDPRHRRYRMRGVSARPPVRVESQSRVQPPPHDPLAALEVRCT
ncbi:type I-E CRISPR-associated protein Cas5/CasD [Nocardiopsis lucentensis]|uniref:type I-E CRISPR-associated protein Cas5/CasD n=1 Tax=Nocardiopsis lucentensis TaxID=53441 RepID=UPI00034AD361|nr:type I-E CRISPR-associated protein Cas5/CasD [Nocardiopsis lucentensis]